MKQLSVNELILLAMEKSPFYRALYKTLDQKNLHLDQLPIINEDDYQKANTFHNNQVKTDEFIHGIALRSGGSTGKPKVSLFTFQEWELLSEITMKKLCQENMLIDHDVVANLFVSGNMYGTFLLLHDVLQKCDKSLTELPISIGANINTKSARSIIHELGGTVAIGTPYALMSLASSIKEHKLKNTKIERFLYGGDLVLESQEQYLKKILPNVILSSSGYASTECGFLGYSDSSCHINEYRSDMKYTILEIIDRESGDVINSINKAGQLVATNLAKTLTPIIRYPVGDLAMWLEKENQNRKFKLCGRNTKKDEQVHINGNVYDYLDIYHWLDNSNYFNDIIGFQLIKNNIKELVLQIAIDKDHENNIVAQEIQESVYKSLDKQNIPKKSWKNIKVKLIHISELQYNARTYKAIQIQNEFKKNVK